ncbi:MAG: hypothetical protein A2138_08315 [Deltaproteobacteria bacterium RBG_16_71_12]|nr:MAG: hypothetical protein A2138_08315 [Deltaproteobacteria bacterium RBG_16_71_12]
MNEQSVEGLACPTLLDGDVAYALLTDQATGYVARIDAAQEGAFTMQTFRPNLPGEPRIRIDLRRVVNDGGCFTAEKYDPESGTLVESDPRGCLPYLLVWLAINSRCASVDPGGAPVGDWLYDTVFVAEDGSVFAAQVEWELRSESRRMIAEPTFFSITPELPDETTFVVEHHLPPFDGFTEPRSPGGTTTYYLAIAEARCLDEDNRLTAFAGQPLHADLLLAAGSGGHTHLASDEPAYRLAIADADALTQNTTIGPHFEIDGITELLWPHTVRVMLHAGEVAGRVEVVTSEVETLSHFFPGDAEVTTGELTVAVPGLVPIPPSSNYQLTGNRYEPPAGVDGLNHDGNHFLVPGSIPRLEALVVYFNNVYPCCILRADDASLESGGMFDVKGNFDPTAPIARNGHVFHRTGIDIDFRATVADVEDGSTWDAGFERIKQELSDFVNTHGMVFAPEESVHVRLFQ